MNKKSIRLRICKLLDSCKGCPNNTSNFRSVTETKRMCGGCDIYKELTQLRSYVDRPPAERFKHILDKGPDMKRSDVIVLIERGVTKKDIKHALEIKRKDDYRELLENLELYGLQKAQEMEA
ncbi:hypothetical protein JMM81_12500 [Bacillus sp. V3B]|uniref:hypothetical protein n=1 Tax=Bacillus sp. V3B TaxID=2804915 RepID=UPI00210DA006|nr:hypothetical protein [Bacillus sp. V3B]MCQ6275776.1 hypothetical protein [Bacillus sp. V3B]